MARTDNRSVLGLAATICVTALWLSGCDTRSPDGAAREGAPSAEAIPFVTSANFQREVLESEVPVLVDFYADWCGPCKIQGRILDELVSDLSQQAKIVKVDIDQESDLASRYDVSSIPTLVIIKDGETVARHVGVTEREAIMASLTKAGK